MPVMCHSAACITSGKALRCQGGTANDSRDEQENMLTGSHRYMRTVAMRWPPFSGRAFNGSWK